jgi:hypothetical protein
MPPEFQASPHLKDLDAVLLSSLQAAGYEMSYYAVPGGFAQVARLERIQPGGEPYRASRFDPSFHPLDQFTMSGYLFALLVAPPGYYRVIVFVVTPEAFEASGKPVSADEATSWLESGANKLPASIGNKAYSSAYACTALIYEFEKRDTKSNPEERHPGRLTAETHLAASGIALGLWPRSTP